MNDINFITRLEIRKSSLGLTNEGMSRYMCVPLNTYNKWVSGARKPSASSLRLLELLEMIEAFCPTLHDLLVPSTPKGQHE